MKIHLVSAIAITFVLIVTMFSVSSLATMMGPYPDYPTFIAAFRALADSYPQRVSYEIIGKTVENQNIMMFRIGNPSGGVVLFDGALHGWEAEGSQLLYDYAKWLLTSTDSLAQRTLANTCTLIIPVVNIDSYFTNRTNAHGVDLNRNFATNWQYGGSTDPTSQSYRGPSPLSEPESQALTQVFQTRKPTAYVNVHDGGGELIYASSYTNSTYLSSVTSKIDSLSVQRGVSSYSGPTVIGGPGEAISDAAKTASKTSFLLELGNGTRTLSEISAQVLPRFIPIAAVLSQESEGNGSKLLFEDSFESGNFSNWNGTQVTSGETMSVTDRLARQGMHSAVFTADGDQSLESAYAYENVQASAALFARGYFIATSFVETGNYSRFYFAAFAASGTNVAMAGCLRSGNAMYWRLTIMNGTNWVTVDTQTSSLVDQWYRFELQWTQSSTNGYGKLFVDNKLVCSVSGINTTAYGAANSVRFGIAQSGYAKTMLYLDCVQVSQVSLGSLPIPADLDQSGKLDIFDMIIFAKAFGSTFGSGNWNPTADINADGIVDIRDALLVALHYGE